MDRPGARARGVDLVSFPELTMTGYPPEDMLTRPRFIADDLERWSRSSKPRSRAHHRLSLATSTARERHLNAAAVIHDGRIVRTPIASSAPAELRRLRGAALYPPRRGVPRCRTIGPEHRRRRDLLRGTSGIPGDPTHPRALGRRAVKHRSINGSALPRKQAPLPGEMLANRAKDASASRRLHERGWGSQDGLVVDGGSMILGPHQPPRQGEDVRERNC